MLKFTLFAFLALLSVTARAEEDPCEGGSKQAMALCASNKASAADAMLNNFYQRALSAAGPKSARRSELVSAQRQWLKFLAASCKLEQSFSLSDDLYWLSAASDQCMARLSFERAKTLEYYTCVFSDGAAEAQCNAP